MRSNGLFIGGAWIAGAGRDSRIAVDPATGQELARTASATADDLDAAAGAAAEALSDWSALPAADRGAVLREIGAMVRSDIDRIAPLITAEMGKPIGEARTELDGVAGVFEYFGDVIAGSGGAEEILSDGLLRQVERRAVGPVLVLNTWNFPVETVSTPLAPALAAGCSAIVLANPVAPSPVAAFFEILEASRLPAGTVNLLAGNGPALSAALIEDPRVAHVAYTGSVAVGRELAARAGRAIKRATLELGGNAPAIALPDADAGKTAECFAGKRFWNSGQVCTAPNRIYVHRSIYDDFVEAAAAYAQALVVGPGSDPRSSLGPLATAARKAAMIEIAADARRRGAREVFSGAIPNTDGAYFPPTVFAEVPDDALGMREEIFGPIACIAPYEDVADVIARANDCALGLSAYVYGADQDRATAVARQLEAGSVGINQMVTAFTDAPFGGMKESGLGAVGGAQAIAEFQKFRLLAQAS